MDEQILAVVAAFAFLYSIVASRLERTPINGPLVYLVAGLLLGQYGLGWVNLDVDGEGLKTLAELTLALVLFSDSANSDLKVLRTVQAIPTRLLLVGLPLTILAGFFTGNSIFEGLTLIEVALLATMLAPTDAALGQAVVTNPSVPPTVRESLNVESGLNDGICVPVLLIFLALATGQSEGSETFLLMLKLPLQQIGVGVAIGASFAVIGSSLLKFCAARDWISGAWVQIPIIALAMSCYGFSQILGGSGFIGCFVCGMTFGGLTSNHAVKEKVLNGAEGLGNGLSMLTWFCFGAVAFGKAIQSVDARVILYAVLSLTIVRIIPVFLCLVGIPLRSDSKLFIGWFGPRGLASIVFVVMVIDAQLPGNDTLVAAVTWTVALSIIAHGMSAVVLARKYGDRVSSRDGVV